MALENKLNLTDAAELARQEERISKKKAMELFESGFLDKLEQGSCRALCEIHRHLFSGIRGENRGHLRGQYAAGNCETNCSKRQLDERFLWKIRCK